jgi:Outer membrane protein beta-barrel domain
MMKKTGLLFFFCLLTYNSFSQVKFSLRVAPAVAITREVDKDSGDSIVASNNGSGGAFSGGAALDFFITDNLAFNFGLNYLTTQANVKYSLQGQSYTYKRTLQYVQAPVTFKAFTNEIVTDMQLYFQLGATLSVKISEKLKKSNALGKDLDADENIISPVDAGVYLGAGVLYKIGESNALFAGVYYNRGLTNITLKNTNNVDYNKYGKTSLDLIGIEAGIRF